MGELKWNTLICFKYFLYEYCTMLIMLLLSISWKWLIMHRHKGSADKPFQIKYFLDRNELWMLQIMVTHEINWFNWLFYVLELNWKQVKIEFELNFDAFAPIGRNLFFCRFWVNSEIFWNVLIMGGSSSF